MRITMRDGIRVAADLYLPDTEQAVPVIVMRTPYGRSTDPNVEQGLWFAARGYGLLVVDVRGRGDSEGTFVPYRGEGLDGYDTIEWAAAQSWCDGNVGTLGASYLGKIQWLTALTHPSHLRAMVPIVSPSDPFVEWPTGVPGPMHLCWQFLVADRVPQNINRVPWEQVYAHLPLVTMDEASGREMPLWRELFHHCQLDDWWRATCYQDRFREIDLPVLHISGWYDDEQIGTPLNFSGMTHQAPSESARKSQRLIMGPWGHNVNTSTRMGDLDFGQAALMDLRSRELRFFDRWLKGQRNGVDEEHPISIFIMGKNRWREEAEWPLARTVYTSVYLHSRGNANSRFGDGTLSLAEPEAEKGDSYVYNPWRPVPFLTEPTSLQIGGPDDYSAIHRRDDVLVYTGEPLTQELEVTGPVKACLYASTSAPDTDFMVQLHDVWPDGYTQRLCDGMIRVRFSKGMDAPELVEPDSIRCYEINCWNTAHVFLPGHRICVHVASSAFPKYDRNQNTGEPLGLSERIEAAFQTIYHDAEHPSAIILPVIP